LSNVRDSRLPRLIVGSPPRFAGPIGLGRFESFADCRPGRIPFIVPLQRQPLRLRLSRAVFDVLTCDRPAAPNQSGKRGTTGELIHDRLDARHAPSSASLEVSYKPFSTRRPCREFALTSEAARLRTTRKSMVSNGAARNGGRVGLSRSMTFESHRVDSLFPSSLRSFAQVRPVEPIKKTRSRTIQPCRATPLGFVSSSLLRVMHRRVLHQRGVPLRGRRLSARPCRKSQVECFLLPVFASSGGAPGFFCRPFAGLLPRMGERSISGARAHVSLSHAIRPPRLIFVGVTEHPSGKHLERAIGRGRFC